MSNVIQFLEGAGRNTALTPSQYATAVAALDIDDAHRDALGSRDFAALSELLDGRRRMFCLINGHEEQESELLRLRPHR